MVHERQHYCLPWWSQCQILRYFLVMLKNIQSEFLTCTYILAVDFWNQKNHFFFPHFSNWARKKISIFSYIAQTISSNWMIFGIYFSVNKSFSITKIDNNSPVYQLLLPQSINSTNPIVYSKSDIVLWMSCFYGTWKYSLHTFS